VDIPTITRALSSATRRRSGTLVDEGTGGHRTEAAASIRSSVHDDVCFPPEEITNTYKIDFEDLEEFVSQSHTKTPVAHPFTPLFTRHNEQYRRTFGDQRGEATGYFPDKTESSGELDSDKVDIDEKMPADFSDALSRTPSRSETQNRFTFFSSEMDETVHAPELGDLLMPHETFRDLFELNPEGGVWWLDMLNPSEEEIFAICGAFRVHPLTREDITTQETREKVELFKSYYFVCFTSFYAVDKSSENYLEPINIYAVVFREGLLTFSFCQNPHIANVRKRIGKLRDYVNLSADWICYALIDEIVDAFGPVLREVERETDTIEDSVYTARFEDSRAMLQQIGECRKRVMSLSRLLGGKADVIKGFAKKCNESYAVAPRGDVGLYLSDVQDHIVTMMSNLGHFEKMLGRSHSNHLAQITLRHTEQGSRANELLGKITVFATILVPLNLVAGLFGMNVEVPGRDSEGLGWWFGIVGVIIAFTLVCVAMAKRLKLI
jgi:magnesium transporter